MARSCATHHAIMFFFILSILSLLPNIPILFIAQKTNKPRNINRTSPSSSSNVKHNCSNSSSYLILSFLCGIVFTSILIITINLPSIIQNLLKTAAVTAVDVSCTCFRRIKQWSPRLSTAAVSTSCPAGGSNGLHPSLIKTLPTFAFSIMYRPRPRSGIGTTSACAICLYEFREDQIIRWLPECDHMFHKDCIDVWFCSNRTCPCCRISLA